MRAGLLTAVILTAAMTPAFAQGTSAAAPNVAMDGAGAKSGRVDNTHKTRFIEIFLAHPDAKTGKLVAECYNTIFTSNGIPASRDTAPQARVEGLDFARMKTDYGVKGASLNGPKIWLPDWTEIDIGVERDFNGMKAAWVARLNMGDNAGGVAETTPYKPMKIARKSGLGWKQGNTVLLLDDAEGNTWVMKGFQLGLKPTKTSERSWPQAQATSRSSHRAGSSGPGRWTAIWTRNRKVASPRSWRTSSSTSMTRPGRA